MHVCLNNKKLDHLLLHAFKTNNLDFDIKYQNYLPCNIYKVY